MIELSSVIWAALQAHPERGAVVLLVLLAFFVAAWLCWRAADSERAYSWAYGRPWRELVREGLHGAGIVLCGGGAAAGMLFILALAG